MNIAGHFAKAERIEHSMDKLDHAEDYETIIENCMLAGTHYLNAALHARGVTAEDWDLLHSDKPDLEKPAGEDLLPILAAMKFVEDLRPPYLRGNEPYDVSLTAQCLERYRKVRDFAREVAQS